MHIHIPVLAKEIVDGLSLNPGAVVIDATVGLAGHAKLILDKTAPSGVLIGFDRDKRNLEIAANALSGFGSRVELIQDSFANLGSHDLPQVDGVLFDLGYSSVHVDDASRGFSFQKEGPLDMRYDTSQEISARTIVNSWTQDELTELFQAYGEEPHAREIAKVITTSRRKEKIETTTGLAELIETVVRKRGRIHPATRVFQALRMEVNDELGQIELGLSAAVSQLKTGGILAVISFHSLEDRLVKRFINNNDSLNRLTKKPIRPTWEEQKNNPRSRSAKLRLAEKL